MTERLILVESPNKVKHVQHYAEEAGFPARVMGTVGHMLDMPPMKEGDCVDKTTFEPTALVPKSESAAKILAQIESAAANADLVIVASDDDREGELIAEEAWSRIPSGKAVRTVFKEITPEGVAAGLQPGAFRKTPDHGRVEAAMARRTVDRLFGWHATQATFQKLRQHSGLSAGRVQSIAARLVVERTREHDTFKPREYFTLWAKLRKDGKEFMARVKQGTEPISTDTRDQAQAFKLPSSLPCSFAEAKEVSRKPRPPFTNSTWLQTAQKALKMPVARSSEAIQRLFEDGSTTYPRTDSVRVDPGAIAWAREEIARRFGPEYVPAKPWEHKDRAGVQGAHEALRPTKPGLQVEGENAEAFSLIQARFLASQAAAQLVEQTILRFETPEGLTLEAKGNVEKFPGWKKVLQTEAAEEEDDDPKGQKADEDDEEGALPAVSQGDLVEVVELVIKPATTKPPALYTQAGLVADLERKGIGRPSTFKSMVQLILDRGFVIEEEPAKPKKTKKGEAVIPFLRPVEKGFDLVDFLLKAFPRCMDYSFTADLEKTLDRIEDGKEPRKAFLETFWGSLSADLAKVEEIPVVKAERKDLGPCPKCAAEGRAGHLRLIKGVGKESGKPYEFGACELDTKETTVCGYTAPAENGELKKLEPCPECGQGMKPITKKDKSQSWKCEAHGWFMADKAWRIVKAPACPKCKKPMVHRSKKENAAEFFWACFECKQFNDSDKFGKVVKDTKPKAKA
jgi:DNA topoisomerase-1